jgi:hypothetical protein
MQRMIRIFELSVFALCHHIQWQSLAQLAPLMVAAKAGCQVIRLKHVQNGLPLAVRLMQSDGLYHFYLRHSAYNTS